MRKTFGVPKLSLITGAANGLGCEIACRIMASGGRVVVIDNDAVRLTEISTRYEKLCIPILFDLANLDGYESLFEELVNITDQHGQFSLVLFNAAISATGKFALIPQSVHRKIFALNTLSPMMMAGQLARQNLMTSGSAMVFISSLSHQTGYPGAAVYAASKDAIAIYAKSIRKPFAKRKIHIMSVFPGPIRTKMAERHSPKNARPEKRMPPSKIAERILQAASRGQSELYPDIVSKITVQLAAIFPKTLTKIMRRIIFEKLDGETF